MVLGQVMGRRPTGVRSGGKEHDPTFSGKVLPTSPGSVAPGQIGVCQWAQLKPRSPVRSSRASGTLKDSWIVGQWTLETRAFTRTSIPANWI